MRTGQIGYIRHYNIFDGHSFVRVEIIGTSRGQREVRITEGYNTGEVRTVNTSMIRRSRPKTT